jgi:GT2 family glycosyltransferase
VLPAEADGHVPSVTYRDQPEVFAGRLFADVLYSNNMAIRRQAFDEVGPFDERLGPGSAFPSAEDNDFGYRLLEAGYTIEFVPKAVVHHRGARRGRELTALQWAYGCGQGAFYAKHMSPSDLHMLRRFGRNAAYRLRRMARAVRGEPAALREGVYLAGLFWGALSWWARARRG